MWPPYLINPLGCSLLGWQNLGMMWGAHSLSRHSVRLGYDPEIFQFWVEPLSYSAILRGTSGLFTKNLFATGINNNGRLLPEIQKKIGDDSRVQWPTAWRRIKLQKHLIINVRLTAKLPIGCILPSCKSHDSTATSHQNQFSVSFIDTRVQSVIHLTSIIVN